MARVFIPILLATICIQYTKATCNQKVVDAIKEVSKGQDGLTSLEPLVGDYQMVYMFSGPMSAVLGNQCIKVSFYKTPEGKYEVAYNGPVSVKYTIKYEDGAIKLEDNDKILTYCLFDGGVIGLYTCNKSPINFTFTAIAVNTAVEDASAKIEEMKKTLTSFGAKGGVAANC